MIKTEADGRGLLEKDTAASDEGTTPIEAARTNSLAATGTARLLSVVRAVAVAEVDRVAECEGDTDRDALILITADAARREDEGDWLAVADLLIDADGDRLAVADAD